MPSGRTHDRITLWSLPVVAGLTFERTRSSGMTLCVAAGFLLGGLMLGPDLDIYSVQFKRWGWLRWIWLPYRNSLRHRSALSHGPVIGTVLRVIYLMLWVAFFGVVGTALINQVWQLGWTWGEMAGMLGRSLQQYQYQWLALLIGLEIGAFSHYISDWSTSTYKRYRRQGWRSLLPKKKRPTRKSRRSTPKRR